MFAEDVPAALKPWRLKETYTLEIVGKCVEI